MVRDVAGSQRNVVAILVFLFRITPDDLKQRDLAAARIAEANVGQGASLALIEFAVFHAEPRGGSRGPQRRAFANRPLAIDAVYFNSPARFGVEHTVALRVLTAMAIYAAQTFFNMNLLSRR